MEDNFIINKIMDNFITHFKLTNIKNIQTTQEKDKDPMAKYLDGLIIDNIIKKKSLQSIYYFGIRQKMFNVNYDFYKEIKWIIQSEKKINLQCSDDSILSVDNFSKESVVEKLHDIYYKILNRGADLSLISKVIENNISIDYNSICYELSHSIEKYCIDWVNEYYLYYSFVAEEKGKFVKNNSHTLIDYDYFYNYLSMAYKPNHFENIKIVMDEYSKKLNYIPSQQDLEYFWIYKNHSDFKNIVNKVISDKDDYKYLEECRTHFSNINNTDSIPCNTNKNIKKIKFYGPVGTSGYAKICRDIIKSLYKDALLQFIPIQFQNYSIEYIEHGNELLSSCSKNIISDPDYIILHSVPDLWPSICIREREIMNIKGRIVPIYGITVWETETLPKDWDVYCQFVDKISVPSFFSSIAFNNSLSLQKINQQIDIVHHPVLYNNPNTNNNKVNACILKKEKLKDLYDFIFYNISEWTNRKGISELVESFHSKFNRNSKVLLYIKTFGDISKEESNVFMEKYNNPSNIIIDYERVDDTYIQCIHDCGDCFVSLTKSEGQGIGLCHAALNKKNIIVTGYSGHLDYLKNVNLINYTMEAATFCTTWSKKHDNCKYLPYCQYFNLFIPSTHSWAKPCIIDAGNKMMDVYKKRKSNIETFNYISKFNSDKFCTDLLKSLKSTTPRKSVNFLFSCEKIKNQKHSQLYYFDWKIQNKKKIVVIGASKNGNVGDDMYPFVITEFFKENGDYDIVILSDTEVEMINNIIVVTDSTSYNKELSPFDYLIIGGGGLLNMERMNKKNSIHIYSDYARKNKIPYYMISIGFQDLSITDTDEYNKYKFSGFSSLLNGSEYTSLRSPSDYHIANLLVDRDIKDYIFQYPDLGYSLKKYTMKFNINKKRNILLVTIDPWIDINKKYIQYDILRKINNYKMKKIEYRLVFTVFTGVNNKNNLFVSEQEKIIKKIFPECEILPGLQPDIKDYHYPSRTSNIYTMTQILTNTHTIVTGRYHGYILAKTFGVPYIETYGYCNYKLEAEKKTNCNSSESDSLIPLETINKYIQKGIYFRGNELLDDDNRNNNIVNLHKKSGMDISIIQNWTNKKILESLYDL